MTARKFLKKTAKILAYTIGGVLVLLIAVVIFLNTGYAKRLIASKVQSYLEGKIKTKVRIASINYRLPEWIQLEGVYIEDQKKDTLLYGGKLAVSIDMFKLIKGGIDIRKVELDNIVANVSRSATDSNYNFQFIINAFASPQTTTKKDTSALNIVLKEFLVNDLALRYIDDYGGQHITTRIKNLDITVNKFQPDQLRFELDKIKMDSSSIQYASFKPNYQVQKKVAQASASNSMDISLRSLELENDEIGYDDNTKPSQKEGLDPSHLYLKNMLVNIDDIKYNKDSIVAVVKQFAFKEKSGFVLDTTHARIFYSDKYVSAVELYIKTPHSVLQNAIKLNYDSIGDITYHPKNTKLFAQLKNTTIAVDDIYTLMPSVKNYLQPSKFKNNVISVNTKIDGTMQQLNIPSLQIAGLSGSAINAKATLYNVTDAENLGYDINVYNSHIEKNDLLKFLPANSYAKELSSAISFSTHAKGNLKNSSIDINITGKDFSFTGNAIAKNLNRSGALQYNVHIKQGRIDKAFLMAIAPPNSIPSSIELPETILLKGDAHGDMNNIDEDLVLDGSDGMIAAKGYVHGFKNTASATYDLQLSTDKFEAGRLLKEDSSLGAVTLIATAKGQGFNYKTMHTAVTVHVSNAEIKQHSYTDMAFNANLNGGDVISKGAINDSDLKFHYDISANVAAQYPSDINALFVLDTFYAQKLHLYADTLNVSFKAIVKGGNLDPKQLDLYASVDSIKLDLRNRPYAFDSIMAKATTANGVHTIVFRSPLADADAKGSFDYDKIGTSVMQFINKYYKITDQPPLRDTSQQISFTAVVKNNIFITDMFPGLDYDNIALKGSYASSGGDSALSFNVKAPRFVYNEYTLNNGKIDISSSNDQISYAVNVDAFSLGKRVFYGTTIKGDLANDSINIDALTKDEHKKDWYGITAAITDKDNAYTISLKKWLLLNYQQWSVPGDNKISYSSQGILVKDFKLENNRSAIEINSTQQVVNSPIDITISDFDIKAIASILSSDTLLASGTMNGKIELSNLEKKTPSFTGNLTIDKLQFMQQPVGDVKLYAQALDDNSVKATLDITGDNNTLSAKGTYYLNNTQDQFNLDLAISKLSMATLQTFAAGNISRASGSINGNITVNGNFNEPHWNGYLNFDSARFTVVKTGAAYSISDQKIAFSYPVITLKDFIIRDSANNYLSLDGSITAQSISEYGLSLNLYAEKFAVLSTAHAIDNQVYGYATVNADVNISGNTAAPDIEGDISLNRKSDVTLVLPEQNIDKDAARTVVRFVDMDTFKLTAKPGFSPVVVQESDLAQFLNYNLNININKDATLTVIIDPSTGDELQVQGDAQLNAGVDPGGNIVLAGEYNLNKGHYIMNYKFLKKQFNLLDSSTIIFAGSPMDAEVNITAEYIANCAPADLLENEVEGLDPRTAGTFNQKIPFKVILHLKGNIKKPDISFDIQLPDENSTPGISSEMRTTIENKLAQVRSDVAVTNKEVFSLLLLGHFVGEQSTDFFKGNGTSTDEVLRESVSSFLSTALNQVTSDLVKGVDINVNLNSYEDYSTGAADQRTDLDVAVSKNFINDRLTVTAGKNFDVNGEDAATRAEQQNTDALPDLTINYKLSKSGRYSMKAYKKDQFEETLNGYITQTGLGFLFAVDYDKFKEIFEKKKDKKDKKSGNE